MCEDYAQAATRLLAQRPPTTPTPTLGERGVAVGRLEIALRARGRRRTWGRAAAGGALLLAVAALATFARRPPARVVERVAPPPVVASATTSAVTTDAILVREGISTPLRERAVLRTGDRIRATGLSLALTGGTLLTLADRADFELRGLGAVRRFALHDGRLRADVAKLHAGQRFLIDTTDAEVEVRGTSFEVRVLPPPGCARTGRTEVRVFEGVVTVRGREGEVKVVAGQTWPPGCLFPEATAPVPPRPIARAMPLAPRRARSSSTLEEQNDLFAAALRARHAGDAAGARWYLDELLRRFPASPLAETARAERGANLGAPADAR